MKKTLASVVIELKKLQAEQDQIRKEAARLEKRQNKLTKNVQQFFHEICQDAELATGLARAIEPQITPGSEILYLEAFSKGATPEILESYLKKGR
jgi:predicted transcriptional regulator